MPLSRWFASVIGNSNDIGLPNVDASHDTLITIFNTIFLFTGTIALIVIIVAGFRYVVLAPGNSEALKKNWQMIIYAAAGLIISVSADIIVNFVIGRLT